MTRGSIHSYSVFCGDGRGPGITNALEPKPAFHCINDKKTQKEKKKEAIRGCRTSANLLLNREGIVAVYLLTHSFLSLTPYNTHTHTLSPMWLKTLTEEHFGLSFFVLGG